MNRRTPLRQADLSKALKAAALAGLKVQRFEIDPDGRIIVVTGQPENHEPPSLLEAWKAKRARKQEAQEQEARERAEVRAGTLRAFGKPARRRGRHDPGPLPGPDTSEPPGHP